MSKSLHLAILGAGNIGMAIAKGLHQSGQFDTSKIILTRRKIQHLKTLEDLGFKVQTDNLDAVIRSEIILVCVEPQQLDDLLHEIKDVINPQKHLIISVVTGARIKQIEKQII